MSELPKPDWTNPVHLLAFGMGSGAAPKAPGTVGTLAAIPLFLGLRHLPPEAYIVLVAAMFLVGIWLCGKTSRDLGVHDHGGIVWDEWVGLLVTLWMIPPGWMWLVAGFLLFRLFDILKPWPIGWLDRRVSGGFGIMLDDLVAGLLALAVVQLGQYG
ncbi:phosphatidylglycerophosphatase A family protein [Solemya velesiana gill symbiont]|uniref:Phosphatidylglycerophosphatase A n=1 Tax=Solemya velesiana gill symbiont TaxID=1918948 RepID=A0A1T2KVD9_9GAMM|nr:phosphatidylglycerophosphatase A [Solemya velesiana gill symbiont]OOZ36817.1 phosphatidylglycerophosphatase A [Solemya velesiana gill symbiont]